ncbi:hypothetical protein KC19_12G132200 [Ceratodon purpureus]|uniref:Uncharacterized protein n=1 Tax=Ceratodon purpureus TaxID=3225 RepID=A0A8T0GAS9_CERPU|nr:hypothetical protein KC19_12G132200 [Ceratodon purpureus]
MTAMIRDGRVNPHLDADFYMTEECGLLTITEVHCDHLTFSSFGFPQTKVKDVLGVLKSASCDSSIGWRGVHGN